MHVCALQAVFEDFSSISAGGVQGAEGKVREGVSRLAEVRRQAGQAEEEANKAMQAQQAATRAAEHQLQAAEVFHLPNPSCRCGVDTQRMSSLWS